MKVPCRRTVSDWGGTGRTGNLILSPELCISLGSFGNFETLQQGQFEFSTPNWTKLSVL